MNEYQQALLGRARRKTVLARRLLEDGYAEEATSAAYYAMFYLATACLEAEGLAFSKHSAVHAAFGQRFAKPKRLPPELHRFLLEAHEDRLSADYEAMVHVPRERADVHIRRAEQFLAEVEKHLGAS